MFSSALKSFSSNISANYTIAPQPSASSGPWKIFDGKKKSTGKSVSVFVFDKKSLEPPGGTLGGRAGAASVKKLHEEVVERLRKEASSLARLRHPSILELAEPVEETRNGGLMFATEPVTASLAGLLAEKDDQERGGGRKGRSATEASTGQHGTELNELEIQKGLLQVGKGLEFLHESAGLVHANLTPEAIFINAKSDWKISGLGFTGPATDSDKPSSIPPISLSEVLERDPRLPGSVQLNLDYTSPDFVLDRNLTSSADMFSLGLLIVSLYNSPHQSPIEAHGSLSSFKRVFSSSSTVPTQNNNYLSQGAIPPAIASDLLPRLITRRSAQRLTARAFQEAQCFDNILVSTIRFLDALPGKSQNEKAQFLRGLPKIAPQFPSSVLEKKVLPVLLEEMKDRDLLAAILQNVFAITKASSTSKEAFADKVIPKLREVFLTTATTKANASERDTSKEAGLMVVLENVDSIAANCSGKEFRDDILPMIALGLASSTHTIIDAALSTLGSVLPVLDYSTTKNELFPVIANVFAHTNSLGIKVRGLEAFYTLCGGADEPDAPIGDGLDGSVTQHNASRTRSSAVLDKFTVQEKVVPLLKAIKTKEPGVMMAALKVFKQVGKIADSDFLAMEVLPILWSFSLGPLLDLQQFQSFMTLIKGLSSRIEREQTRKLQELSSGGGAASIRSKQATAGRSNGAVNGLPQGEDVDFESLVTGRKTNGTPDILNDWDTPASRSTTTHSTWASQPLKNHAGLSGPKSQAVGGLRLPINNSRSVTPDQSLNAFTSLTPNSPFSQPLQPSRSTSFGPGAGAALPMQSVTQPAIQPQSSINWSAAAGANVTQAWQTSGTTSSNSSVLPPPPLPPSLRVPLPFPKCGLGEMAAIRMAQEKQQQAKTSGSVIPPPQPQRQGQGLDKYESLL